MATDIPVDNPRRLRLWAEVVILFAGVPLMLALVLPPEAMWPVLILFTVIGVALLHFTESFEWSELLGGRFDWTALALFSALTVAVAGTATLVLRPDALFILPREQTQLWLTILLFYPLASALPQELIFRPLFFRRYGDLFAERSLILVNAALFSLAHLMYWSPLVLAMTFSGGLAFAWAWQRRGSFMLALALHAVSGWIVFTLGLGQLFYSGAVDN